MKDEQNTKKCKECGKILPLSQFYHNGTKPLAVCKKCYLKRGKKCKDRRQKEIEADNKSINTFQIEHQFKEIPDKHIHNEIVDELIADDEIFVAITDCPGYYISNYGRCVHEHALADALERDARTYYQIEKWILEENQWICETVIEAADVLVVQEFVVNPDCINNTFIWHSGNDVRDNYYKHLFPLNEKQYEVALAYYDRFKKCTDETILKLMNKRRYMPLWIENRHMRPTVQHIGYAGCCDRDSRTKAYKTWSNMLDRCCGNYNESYRDCTVCTEWLNFSNFRKWYDEHFYQVEGMTMNLDKDILIRGNKVYSPAACAFVPACVNESVVMRRNTNGLPIGAYKNDSTGKYYVSWDKKHEYDTAEEASARYIAHKGEMLIQLAEKMSGKIPVAICDALRNWAVG